MQEQLSPFLSEQEQQERTARQEAIRQGPPRYKPGGVWSRQSKESTALQKQLRAIEESQPGGEWETPSQVERGMFAVPDEIRAAEDDAASRSEKPEIAKRALEAKRRQYAAAPQTNLDLAAAMEPQPTTRGKTWSPQPAWADIGAAGRGDSGSNDESGSGVVAPTSGSFAAGGAMAMAATTTSQLFASGINAGAGVVGAADPATGKVMSGIAGSIATTSAAPIAGAAAGAAMGTALMPGPGTAIGAALGAITATAGAMSTLPSKITEWTEALVNSKRELAMWSGPLQAWFRIQQRREIRRDIQTARETGGATILLAEEWQDFLDEVRPLAADAFLITAEFAKKGINILETLLQHGEIIAALMPWVGRYLNEILKEAQKANEEKYGEQRTNIKSWMDAWRNTRVPSSRVPRK
jgi:hypothetical protein